MAKILDFIFVVLSLGFFAALSVYKLVLMCRYRNDPDKLQALVSSGQVYPKRLKRFMCDEDADTTGKLSIPHSHIK